MNKIKRRSPHLINLLFVHLAFLLYAVSLVLSYPYMGVRLGPLVSLPVFVIGWFYGKYAGFFAGLCGGLVTFLMIWLVGGYTEAVYHAMTASFIIGNLLNTGIGTAIGRLKELDKKLKRELEKRMQTESDLRISEMKFKTLFEQAGDIILVIRQETMDIVDFNHTAYRELGYSFQEFKKVKLNEIMSCDEEEMAERLAEIDRSGFGNYECRARTRSGKVKSTIVNARQVKLQDGQYIQLIIHDITKQKRMEREKVELLERLKQTEKMHAIGELAGGIAHDFNNQLCGITGYADLLQNNIKDIKLKNYTSWILKAADRATDLTSKLLAFARKGKYQSIKVDMHAVIEEAIPSIEDNGFLNIKIMKYLNAEHSSVMGEYSQLRNVIVHIIINACEAMLDGGELLFETENTSLDQDFVDRQPYDIKPGEYMRLSINDTGEGMSAAVLEHAFEPFFTTREKATGKGMGLSACYGTVKNHGGAIEIKSSVELGTSVIIYLPVIKDLAKVQHVTAGGDTMVEGARIMIVDDENIIRAMFSRMLEDVGYKVATFSCGMEALDYYREHWQEVDLVLLDMIMPDMNGDEVFQKFKDINPDVKAMIISGYSKDSEIKRVLSEGVRYYIQKPFQMAELTEKINSVLTE